MTLLSYYTIEHYVYYLKPQDYFAKYNPSLKTQKPQTPIIHVLYYIVWVYKLYMY